MGDDRATESYGGLWDRITEVRLTYRFESPRSSWVVVDSELTEIAPAGAQRQVLGAGVRLSDGVPTGEDPREDPGRLPESGVTQFWGQFVYGSLREAVGSDTVAELMRRSKEPRHLVRFAFRALDAVTQRIPFETMTVDPAAGPLVRDGERNVSIVRLADSVVAGASPRLQAADPGWYRIVFVTARGSGSDSKLGATEEQLIPERGGFVYVEPAMEEFAGGKDDLRDAARAANADLVVFDAHGAAHLGMDASGDSTAKHISGADMATALEPLGAAAVLSMCGSALGKGDDPSAALEIARRGLPVVLGFQAEAPKADYVNAFVRICVEELRAALLSGRELSLPDWECAIRAASLTRGPEPLTAVLFAHPMLCGDARAVLDVPTRRAIAFRVEPEERDKKIAAATPFYVPGQVGCFELAGRAGVLSMPLPVDVGAELSIEVGAGSGVKVAYSGSEPCTLSKVLVEELLDLWGIAQLQIDVKVESNADTRLWAAEAAEASAFVRALTTILGTRPPDPVLARLDELVAQDWGAHDAAPRLVSADGRRIARFARWPAMTVSRIRDERQVQVADRAALRAAPVAMQVADVDSVERALSTFSALAVLLRHQRQAYAGARGRLPTPLASLLGTDLGVRQPVVIPGVAYVHERSQGAGPPRLAGCQPRPERENDLLGRLSR